MTKQEEKQVIVTDSGIWVRVFGALALVGSQGFFLARMPEPGRQVFILAGWVFMMIGAAMLLFASDLKIIADRTTRTLRLEYRYLWLFRLARDIPFDDLADISAESSTRTSRGHTSTSYRIVAVLNDGRRVPFRWYSFTDGGKKQQAARLRTAVGIVHKRNQASADELPA